MSRTIKTNTYKIFIRIQNSFINTNFISTHNVPIKLWTINVLWRLQNPNSEDALYSTTVVITDDPLISLIYDFEFGYLCITI